MAHYLPMFPLNLVVFPGEERGLYIFEERYKELINECQQTGMTFGIPIVADKQMASVATEVKLVSIDEVKAEGEMHIRIEGIRRFRIISFKGKAHDRLYPSGEVEWLNDDLRTDKDLQKEVTKLINTLHRLLDHVKAIDHNSEDLYTFGIGHDIGLNFEQQYRLLSLDDEIGRLRLVKDHLNTELQKLKVKLNGHFKDYILPDI